MSRVGVGAVDQVRQGAAACKKSPLLFQAVILAHPRGPQERGDHALALGLLETEYLSLDFIPALGHFAVGLSLIEQARCLPKEQLRVGSSFPGCDPVPGRLTSRPAD